MRFAKAQAYGNDFLYVQESLVAGVDLPALAREMCDRHTGIGADGLIVFRQDGTHVPMRLLNADGSLAEVSGNGVRALGALVLLHDGQLQAEVTVDTAAGPKRLTRLARDGTRQLFRSSMGLPTDVRQAALQAGGETVEAIVLSFGNPQCVVLGPLPTRDRFMRLGAALETHPAFPTRTNVEFAEVEAADRVRILIWERGCGPTQSSGTGSCASLIAAAAFGGAARAAEVIAPGGPQRVEWRPDSVYLTGWAEVLCEGEWLRPLPPV
ncbi:MAG: diaminopimelate epimerase [Vicinamibacterales bacterium]